MVKLVKNSQKLIKSGHGNNPVLAVLRRYGIGSEDRHGRGLWVDPASVPAIEAAMTEGPHAIRREFKGKACVFVPGTNQHNYVGMKDIKEALA